MKQAICRSYGPNVLITGASSGIGKAFAQKLASQGLNLVLVARRKERLEALKKDLEHQHSIKVWVCAEDLNEPRAAQNILHFCKSQGLGIDLLINNAGFSQFDRFAQSDVHKQMAIAQVNCQVQIELTHGLLKHMRTQKRGAVIFISSILAHIPTPYHGIYSASKAFNNVWARALACELKGDGIDVLSVLPGFTATEFHSVANRKDRFESSLMRSPDQVVDTALKALGQKSYIVDGFFNNILIFMIKFLPLSLFIIINQRYQDWKSQKK